MTTTSSTTTISITTTPATTPTASTITSPRPRSKLCQSRRRKRSLLASDDLYWQGRAEELSSSPGPGGSLYRGRRQEEQEQEELLPNLDIFLNPARSQEREETVKLQRAKYLERFSAMDSAASFDSMFELLWYSGNPCYDVLGLTSDSLHQKSVVKQCLWKGELVNCSSVFTLTPTDRGMCCRFDVKRQEGQFQANRFSQGLAKLQEQDTRESLDSGPGLVAKFPGDPGPEVGRYKGLSLVLDAHSDLLDARSVAEDSNGFLVGLTQSGEFPLMGQGSHLLKPGHEHFLSLTAVDTVADAAIRTGLGPEARKCYFPGERALQFHTNYSQSACLFECGLSWATTSSQLSCLPWYFPSLTPRPDAQICDPWSAQIFLAALRRAPRSSCTHCLPDCQATTFSISTSSAPFRPCSPLNAGLSSLCKYSSSLVPPLWAGAGLHSAFEHLASPPAYLAKYQGMGSEVRRNAAGQEYSAYRYSGVHLLLYSFIQLLHKYSSGRLLTA